MARDTMGIAIGNALDLAGIFYVLPLTFDGFPQEVAPAESRPWNCDEMCGESLVGLRNGWFSLCPDIAMIAPRPKAR